MSRVARLANRMMEIGPVRRQSLIAFSSSIGVTIIGFFATIYLAHTAGAAALGGFFLLLAYVSIIGLFTDGGAGGAAVQRISEGNEQNEYFSAHVAVRIVLLTITLLVLVAASPLFIDLNNSGLFIWLILAIVVSTFASIVSTGAYGSGKVGILQVADLINNLVRIAVQVIAIFLGFSVAGLAGGFIAGIIAGLLVNFRYLSLGLVKFGRYHVIHLFAFSRWAFVTGLTGALMGFADTILVGYFLSNTDVGMYRTAFQLASMAIFSMLALRIALYPRVVSWMKQGDLVSVEGALARAFTYSLALAIPAAVGAWVLGSQLLYYLYGAQFAAAGPALSILFLVQIVTVFLSLETMCISALNMPMQVFLTTAAGAIATILFDLLLIPLLGITGAALALLAGTGVFALASHYVLKKRIRIGIEKRPVASILLASALMAIGVLAYLFLFPVENVYLIAGAVVLGMGVYFIMLVRLDRGIRDEIRDLVIGFGIPWPGWF